MQRWFHFSVFLFVLLLVASAMNTRSSASSAAAQEGQQEAAMEESNYLYIEEFEFGTGMSVNEGIAEAKSWVKAKRATGEYKSVRLFIHDTGPRLAVYLLEEPKSWQSIKTGWEKFEASMPDLGDTPFKWGRHSDNLLSEIEVE